MAQELYSQDEPFTIPGYWWRPNGPHRPAGELKYCDSKIQLRLMGGLDGAVGKTPFDRIPQVLEPDIIHGQSIKNTRLTLLHSFYTACQPGGGFFDKPPVPITSSTLTCHILLLGVHLSSPNDACFKKCNLTIPNFARWLDDRPFSHKHSRNEDRPCITVTYQEPEPKIFHISDSIGSVQFRYSAAAAGQWDEGVISQQVYVSIEPNESKDLNWFINVAGQLERFFSLMVGRPVQTTSTWLEVDSSLKNDIRDRALLYLPRRHIEQPSLNPTDFLFRYPDIQEWFPTMLRSWLTQSINIRHALDLLFCSIREPAPFLETRFLPIVQAAEVYARAVVHGRIVDKAEFRKIRKTLIRAVPDDIPEDLRISIEGSLAFANERRLAHRLEALVSTCDAETVSLFCVNRNDFIRGIVDTRNFFTHYTERYENILQDLELHWATVKLILMLKTLLLKRLGIPEERIRILLRKNQKISRERQEWKDISERGSPWISQQSAD